MRILKLMHISSLIKVPISSVRDEHRVGASPLEMEEEKVSYFVDPTRHQI
jgi:hypothetical protein